MIAKKRTEILFMALTMIFFLVGSALAEGWSDFVFEDKPELPSLNSVESYIKEHKHLPDIPSAKDVKERGLVMSEILAKQMQKIEELTLYLINIKKENDDLKAKLKRQNKILSELKELRKRIEALEMRN